MLIYDETSERQDYSEDDAAFDGIADELTDETENVAEGDDTETDAGDAAEDGDDVEHDAEGESADASDDQPVDEEPSVEEETGDDTAETIAALVVDVAGIKERLDKLEALSDLFVDGGGVIAQGDADADDDDDDEVSDVLEAYETIEDMDFTI